MRSDGNNITLSSTLTKRMKMERLWTKFKQFLPTMPLSTAQSSSEQNVESVDDKVKYQLISHADEEATDLNDELFTSRLIDEILDDIGLRLDHWKVFVLLCLVDITCGLGTTILSAILPSLKSDWNISAITAGALTLSIPVGMTLGTMVWGLMSDIYGRKRSIVTSATFILVSALVSAFSTNYYWLWISLFFVGFGATISFQTYVIIAEIFPPRYRSMYSVLTVVFYNLGYLLSAVVSMELSVIGYHWALATVCFPSAIVLIGSIVFLPESPHFYLAAGDEQKALNILHDLAPEMDFSNTILRKHGPEIQRADFTQLFRSGYWKITICACIVTCITYLSHGYFIYTASDVAGSSSSGLKNEELLIRHRYTIMVWMTLPGDALGRDYGDELGRNYGDALGRNYGDALGRDALGRDYGDDLGRNYGDALGRDYGDDLSRNYGDDLALGRNYGDALGRNYGDALDRNYGDALGREYGDAFDRKSYVAL
ncbi:putative transporter svop-1 [Dendronephthya gigantea]|uniref:putative transporter svop-1 n=1 Tax=Dendronephthya gigantea TaxID=151771 RepID=UPI00106CE49C|nr:putative transporter svop-1 [Dendronephthya gigantea]